jgi:hypothetical protein
MNKFADFIERHVYGIIAAIAVYVGIFIYLNLATYPEIVHIGTVFDGARIEMPQDKKIQIEKENIEVPSDFSTQDLKSIGQSANDQREKSKNDWSENKMSAADVEKSVKEYEKKLFEEASGNEQRKKIQDEMDQRKKNQKENTTSKANPTATNGGNKAYDGNVMVRWYERDPHQNNNWYVRNPGYTCGYGSSGKVVVRIKVTQNGDVSSAEYDSGASANANPCMIEQALKYAKMSRFLYSATAPKLEDGWISYTFVSQ